MMATKEAFVEIDGKPYKAFDDALEALRKAWHESKKEAVAEQMKKVAAKGTPEATLPKLES